MKKTFICILSIVFLLVGTLSVMALDESNDELQEFINDKITQFKSEYEN